jgi:hypothetical protein
MLRAADRACKWLLGDYTSCSLSCWTLNRLPLRRYSRKWVYLVLLLPVQFALTYLLIAPHQHWHRRQLAAALRRLLVVALRRFYCC